MRISFTIAQSQKKKLKSIITFTSNLCINWSFSRQIPQPHDNPIPPNLRRVDNGSFGLVNRVAAEYALAHLGS